MRTSKILAVALAATLLLSCCTASCHASMRAKAEVLSPAIAAAWEAPSGVEADVERGIVDAMQDGEMGSAESVDVRQSFYALDEAIESGSVDAIRARIRDWTRLAPLARRGVLDRYDDGEIGFGGMQIFLERIDNLTAALAAL